MGKLYTGRIVNSGGFQHLNEFKTKIKYFQNSRFQRFKANIKKSSKKSDLKACRSE